MDAQLQAQVARRLLNGRRIVPNGPPLVPSTFSTLAGPPVEKNSTATYDTGEMTVRRGLFGLFEVPLRPSKGQKTKARSRHIDRVSSALERWCREMPIQSGRDGQPQLRDLTVQFLREHGEQLFGIGSPMPVPYSRHDSDLDVLAQFEVLGDIFKHLCRPMGAFSASTGNSPGSDSSLYEESSAMPVTKPSERRNIPMRNNSDSDEPLIRRPEPAATVLGKRSRREVSSSSSLSAPPSQSSDNSSLPAQVSSKSTAPSRPPKPPPPTSHPRRVESPRRTEGAESQTINTSDSTEDAAPTSPLSPTPDPPLYVYPPKMSFWINKSDTGPEKWEADVMEMDPLQLYREMRRFSGVDSGSATDFEIIKAKMLNIAGEPSEDLLGGNKYEFFRWTTWIDATMTRDCITLMTNRLPIPEYRVLLEPQHGQMVVSRELLFQELRQAVGLIDEVK